MPSLGRVSSHCKLFHVAVYRSLASKFHGGTLPQRPVRPALIIFPASNLDDPLLPSDEPEGKIHARKTWFRDKDARPQHLAHAGELTSKRSPTFVWRTEKLTFDMQNSKELCTSTADFHRGRDWWQLVAVGGNWRHGLADSGT